jgi:7-keto-8-aminopelargonate synthetase-like enzyme
MTDAAVPLTAPPRYTVGPVEQAVAEAVDAGVFMHSADDVDYDGRHVHIDGAKLLNFGCCSYLDLELREELREGAIEAVRRFGTQFSSSRSYLQLSLYDALEDAVEAMTGGYALVAPTTTLAHIAALPMIAEPGDALIIDKSAHSSLHTAVGLLRSVAISPLQHSRMDLLEEEVARLSKTHSRIWYVIDGLYSMFGDFAPIDELERLLGAYPKLHLYIDDAHSTSWTGKTGRGFALDRLRDRSRTVVALGFAKAFAVGGAALVFPTREEKLRVRRIGGPMMFSGPLQPPLLGAALASARLQLRPEFAELQRDLGARIDHTLSVGRELGIQFSSTDRTPIFYVRFGAMEAALDVVRRLRDQGIYVCFAAFPAVPKNQAGVRFTLSLHNSFADIDRLLEAMSKETTRLGLSTGAAPASSEGLQSGTVATVRPLAPSRG